MTMKLRLLPYPRLVRLRRGRFRPGERLFVFLAPGADEAARMAARRLCRVLGRGHGDTSLRVRPPGRRAAGHIHLALGRTGHREGYTLRVTPGEVHLEAHDPAGLAYGIETLSQLARQFGARLPCLFIRDEPAFPHRGYYLDISRGRVPKLETLLRMVDRLAAFKFNQLQLYIEHVFDFSFDPAIGRGSSPLTPEDILVLDAHCRARHVELVPCLASFGHMGKILSLPAYRHLAEVEFPAPSWEAATWRQRLRGATINPYDAGARKLFQRLFDDFLPLFSSHRFNVCADETYDLGRGRNARRAARHGISRLYLDHIENLRALARRHDKRLMFWGDIMLQHPSAIPRIPADCTVLDWGYEPTTPFGKAARFIEAGLETYVCPATRGYATLFNRVEVARANITGYTATGARLGAAGLLVTDWGDVGHFNMPACSLHGMALAAAMAWNPKGDHGREFDRAFSLQLFDDAEGRAGRLYREAGGTACWSWPFLPQPLSMPPARPATGRAAHALLRKKPEWLELLRHLEPGAWAGEQDLAELGLAVEALELNARKVLLALALRDRGRLPARETRRFARDLSVYVKRYGTRWMAAHRPSDLKRLQRALRAAAHAAARSAP